jgi:hypothetical protein
VRIDGTSRRAVGGAEPVTAEEPGKGFRLGRLSKTGLWGALAVVGVLGGIAVGSLANRVLGADRPGPAAAAPSRPAIVARPAPAVAPAPVAADGDCGAAMETVRALQRTYPSGSMLPEPADQQFTADLERLDRACASTPDLEQAFRDRELTPWMTYLPPTSSPASPSPSPSPTPDPTMTLAAAPTGRP